MTAIIGIQCQDGIVVGSDSIATLGTLGRRTAAQQVHKLEIIKDRMIVGVSGFVGLGQKIIIELEEIWNDKLSKNEILAAREIIRSSLWNHVRPELEAASVSAKVIGHQAAAGSAICETLIGAPIQKNPTLLLYDQQCASEQASEDIPFFSIGSGQEISDPFLAFIRKMFWKNSFPTLGDGIFATLWTLLHVIETNAKGGIGGNPQIAILEPRGEGYLARMLPEERLEEHKQNIQEMETHISNFK